MFVQRFLRIISSWLAALTSGFKGYECIIFIDQIASLHSFSDVFFCLSNGSISGE